MWPLATQKNVSEENSPYMLNASTDWCTISDTYWQENDQLNHTSDIGDASMPVRVILGMLKINRLTD